MRVERRQCPNSGEYLSTPISPTQLLLRNVIYCDQKTTQQIQSIKKYKEQSDWPYDRAQWALSRLELFHFRMNGRYVIYHSISVVLASTNPNYMKLWTSGRGNGQLIQGWFLRTTQVIIHSSQAKSMRPAPLQFAQSVPERDSKV
jgi:hypothetical protein